MADWAQYLIITIAVVVAAVYLYKRLRASLRGKDSLDCPFADQCDGCSCQKPELRDKCEIASNGESCGCGG